MQNPRDNITLSSHILGLWTVIFDLFFGTTHHFMDFIKLI